MKKYRNTFHRLAVIIPAYNEELSILDTVRDYRTQFPEALIVVVDNNSSDKTSEIAKGWIKDDGKGLYLSETRQGKGIAVRKAFQEIDSEVYLITDGDMTYPASEAKRLFEVFTNAGSNLCVFGDRIASGAYDSQNDRPFHSFGNRMMRSLINRFFRGRMSDILTGLRVMPYQFVKSFPILDDGFELETALSLHVLDKRVSFQEVPINYLQRPDGSESKLNTYKDGVRLVRLFALLLKCYKPFYFFSRLGVLTFACSLLPGGIVIFEFIETGKVLHIPSAILATGLGVVSVTFFLIGLVLDNFARYERARFEDSWNRHATDLRDRIREGAEIEDLEVVPSDR